MTVKNPKRSRIRPGCSQTPERRWEMPGGQRRSAAAGGGWEGNEGTDTTPISYFIGKALFAFPLPYRLTRLLNNTLGAATRINGRVGERGS